MIGRPLFLFSLSALNMVMVLAVSGSTNDIVHILKSCEKHCINTACVKTALGTCFQYVPTHCRHPYTLKSSPIPMDCVIATPRRIVIVSKCKRCIAECPGQYSKADSCADQCKQVDKLVQQVCAGPYYGY